MSAPPLTHHEILALAAPFARAGWQVDLAASQRAERRIAFRPLERPASEAVPALQGYYFYADYITGRIWSLRDVNGQWSEPAQEADTQLSISSFGEDEAGELYVVDHGGTIYRLGSTLPTLTDFVYLPIAATPE